MTSSSNTGLKPQEGGEGGRVRFAGWVEPGDDPEPITRRHFRILIECDSPAAFDGLSLNVVWKALPVRVVLATDPRLLEPQQGGELREALEGLAQHTNWELSYGYPDEEAEGEWQVHSVNGGRNDREWTLIGSGQAPAAALSAALSNDTEASGRGE